MRTVATCFLIYLTFSAATAFVPVRRESCSCVADDGSCSASIACPGGCLAFCPSGNCRAVCVKGKGGNGADQSRAFIPARGGSNNGKDTAELSQRARAKVTLNLTQPQNIFSKDIQNTSLWDVNNNLVDDQIIRREEEDFDGIQAVRRALLNDERMSVCFGNISAKDLAGALSSITGLNIHTEPEGDNIIINYSGKGITLKEMVTQMSKRYGVQFSIR